MTQDIIRDRKLKDRSYLRFEFPSTSLEKIYVTMPFFENLQITENKTARVEKYDLLSRSSQLYTYLGADSRKFSLDFNLNFPHILTQGASTSLEDYINTVAAEDSAMERKKFTEK